MCSSIPANWNTGAQGADPAYRDSRVCSPGGTYVGQAGVPVRQADDRRLPKDRLHPVKLEGRRDSSASDADSWGETRNFETSLLQRTPGGHIGRHHGDKHRGRIRVPSSRRGGAPVRESSAYLHSSLQMLTAAPSPTARTCAAPREPTSDATDSAVPPTAGAGVSMSAADWSCQVVSTP